jgi:hypothetical protein
MRYANLLLVLPIFVMLSGCGGGGGGGGGSSVIPLENTVRQMQAGDQWQYAVSGTIANSTQAVPVTGTFTMIASSDTVMTPGNVTARVVLRNWTLAGNSQNFVFVDRVYVTQDALGTILDYGGFEDSAEYWITAPTSGHIVSIPSPMSIGTSWSANVTESNGDTYNEAYTVVGTQTISVPAGRFETYKTSGNGVFSGYPAITTDWYAPQIGSQVRSSIHAVDSTDGTTIDLDAKLTLRNRSVPQVRTGAVARNLWEWARAALRSP